MMTVSPNGEGSGTTESDPLLSKIQYLEDQCKGIFDKASQSIKKAQKHQAKGYNNRQNKGKPFEIGKKCLKRNHADDQSKAKMCKKILGPYTVVTKSGANAYYLKDHFHHTLSRPVPGSHLVHFFEKETYKSNGMNSEIQKLSSDVESIESDDDISSNSGETCQRVFGKMTLPTTCTPKMSGDDISSQIIIISSKELPVSSDESSSIDVGSEGPSRVNPWGVMDVQDIPIEIVDHLSDMECDEDAVIVHSTDKTPLYFKSMHDDDRKIAALKFNLVINAQTQAVQFQGAGKMCPCPPVITQSAKANGACLFNLFLMLLAGRDTYSAIIQHVVCNYISNPVKYKWLQAYIPPMFKSGKDYIVASNMCNFTAWGTEVQIIALAQISRFDIYVYTMSGDWLHYGHSIDNGDDEKSECAFFISNESGSHFDPIFVA